MATAWYFIIAVMLAIYVILDGFDFGAGVIHLLVARTDKERQQVFASIGPVWDGNEVWLLAVGGAIVFAFPHAYASGFSGFYLPLMMVLWLLILRGLSIEFRSKEQNPLWRSFWDGAFCVSSTLMAIVLGAALGNLIRGVALGKDGYFLNGSLFTNFQLGHNPGVLDWYTVLVGLFTLCMLATHGALYLTWKTSGPVHDRSKTWSVRLWAAAFVVGIVTTIATGYVQPLIFHNMAGRSWSWPLIALATVGFFGMPMCVKRSLELPAFLCSAVTLASVLAATTAGAYPNILISTVDPSYSETVFNSSSGLPGLALGFTWWIPAILVVICYFVFLYKTTSGKINPGDRYGH